MEFSQPFTSLVSYHFNEEEEQQYQQQLSTKDVYGWNNLVKNEIDCEEVSQPERGIAGFVSKLYQCLEEPVEGQKYARWCKHNGIDMFIIDCIPKFTETVLPKLFKHCKFASFVRQLNIYGFQRDTDARKSKDSKDKETCRWHHIYFRPGRRDLFHLIRRKIPKYSRRKRRAPEEEDPETILNVGSGDESDTKDNDDERDSTNSRRFSASSISASPSPLRRLPTTNVLEYDESSPYVQQQPQREASQQLLVQPQPQLDFSHFFAQNTTTPNGTISYPQSISPTETSLVDENSFHPFQLTATNTILPSQDNNDVNNSHDLYKQTMAQTEEELSSQLDVLRKGYTRMYKILTEEVNKAHSVIHAQRARIEFLGNSLQQGHVYNNNTIQYYPSQQQQHQQSSGLHFLQTAPTTPIYRQAHHDSFSMVTSPQYNMMFGEGRENDNDLLMNSPSTSNQINGQMTNTFSSM